MEVTEEIAAAISAGVPETELRRLLAQKGFRTLVDDAAEKIERGEISATDALSVL